MTGQKDAHPRDGDGGLRGNGDVSEVLERGADKLTDVGAEQRAGGLGRVDIHATPVSKILASTL